MAKNKDIYGYISKGGYLGQARTSRRNRSNNLIKKWMDNLPKNNSKEPKKPNKKGLIMLIIGIILTLIALISANK